MATTMKIVSNKAIASAAVSSRRTGLAKRTGAISARSNVSGLRKLNKVGVVVCCPQTRRVIEIVLAIHARVVERIPFEQ